MATPTERDFEEARRAISRWLSSARPDDGEVDVGPLSAPAGTGFSNETLLLDATWARGAATRTERLVVRVQPTGYRVFMEDGFEDQYRVIKALGESGKVKVAPMVGFEPDPGVLGAPFFVMERVPGEAPSDTPPYNEEGFLVDMTPSQRERLWLSAMDSFTAVHRVDYRDLGLEFLAKPERGHSGLDQQITYAEESFRWAAGDRPQAVTEAAWEWLRAHVPHDRPTELSWGDARMGNMLFDEGECRAVLDWEMASLGGREMDLGWWLFLDRFHSEGSGLRRLAGLGTRADTLSEWQGRTGLVATDVEFYEVFAGFRFAVVMIRIARMAQERGLPVPPDMETDNAVTQVLARLLEVSSPSQP